MKKRPIQHQIYNPKKRKLLSSILFFSVLLVVALIALYLIFSSKDISLSPDEGTGLENTESILAALGTDGTKWYCGKVSTITDGQGNIYGTTERQQLENVLGNKKAICGSTIQFNPFAKTPTPTPALVPVVTKTPTPTPMQTPIPAATKTPTPTPSASASASASASIS